MSTTQQTGHLPIVEPHPIQPARSFADRARDVASDETHFGVIRNATDNYGIAVDKTKGRFVDYAAARRRASAIKADAIDNLHDHLLRFEEAFTARGGTVHWAETAEDARRIVLEICRSAGATHVVKGKSMVSEEIELNHALAEGKIEPVETDLGEFICQIRDEPPYHIVTPVMHLTKQDIADTFAEKLHTPPTDQAEELTMQARDILRDRFVSAQVGITGGNFLVADVGMIAITENEGNARLSFSVPEVHVALVGIEKVIGRLEDLPVMWPVLAASGTGQHLTCYNSLIGGPARPGEADGPREMHVVLLDNGRTRLLADPEQRDAARCIRCGACLNVCPIFKTVGGHTYGTTYQGPIGSVITPHLRGLGNWKHLSYASSLCGRCTEVCPVGIDLHHHLLENRRNAVSAGYRNRSDAWLFKAWLFFMKSRFRYGLAGRMARIGQWFYAKSRLEGRRLDPIAGWSQSRTVPKLAKQSFRSWWAERGKKGGTPVAQQPAPARSKLGVQGLEARVPPG